MTTNRPLKSLLADHCLAPSKKLGQNFLVHRQMAERIASFAEAGPADTVVELGVGFGALTRPLAARVGRVIGLELDSGIIRFHEQERDLPENVQLIHEDLLKADFRNLARESGGQLKIMANLPYSVSNPLLFKLLENREVMDWAVLMLQKEVADRLTASVGSRQYSILSVLLASCASVVPLLHLGPEQFHPRPKVDSLVVRLTFDPPPERSRSLPPHDFRLLHRLVKAAFQQRRKTLLNGLASVWPELDKDQWRELLVEAHIEPGERAERLELEQYVRLTMEVARSLAG